MSSTSLSLALGLPIRIFSLILSLNKKLSCETKAVKLYNCFNGISLRLYPPIFIFPSVISQYPAINFAKVDLPLPLGPTKATVVPSFMFRDIP